jgi:UDP-GlcNAc:undecaprenyl-phosphate/decaprenyl-phosphate GlcNAc-1-phosphate transferase
VILLVPFVAALAASLVLTPAVRALARRLGLIARPSRDRWHEKPTALLGGAAVYGGFLAGLGAAFLISGHGVAAVASELGRPALGILLAATLMFLVGLVDDRLHLRPTTKLVFQGLAAATLVSFGVLYPVTPWTTVNVLITFFWFLALTNALNLLDNMDGVAVGVAGIAALFLAATFLWEGATILGVLCLTIAGAAFGFLPFNFHRASIFMGDSGSLFLGAVLAGLGAAYPGIAPGSIVAVLFVPAVIVAIPILDTALVTVSRALAGRPISLGGRDHTTHRLVAMGLSERQVALLLYGFAMCGGLLAVVLRGSSTGVAFAVGAIFLVGLLILAGYLSRLHTYEPSQRPTGRATLLISDLLHKRRAFEVVLDLILFAVAYQIAYLIRWDGSPPLEQRLLFESTIAIAVAAKSVSFGLFGVYRGEWHRIGLADVHRLLGAAFLGSLLTISALYFLHPGGFFSRGIFFIDGLLTVVLAIGARAAFRSLDMVRQSLDQVGVPTLLYGAGKGGELVVREILANPRLGLKPVGFLDDDPVKHRRLVHGYPVLGSVVEAAAIIARRNVKKVIVCSGKMSESSVTRLCEVCRENGAEVLQLQVGFLPVRGVIAPPEFPRGIREVAPESRPSSVRTA